MTTELKHDFFNTYSSEYRRFSPPHTFLRAEFQSIMKNDFAMLVEKTKEKHSYINQESFGCEKLEPRKSFQGG